MSFELPLLRLGLAGFSADEQGGIGARLARIGPSHVAWQRSPFAEADAWWLHGGRVQPQADGTLRIPAGLPTDRALHLSLPEIDRPVAFSLPLASAQIEASFSFDPKDDRSMAATLQKFTAWLEPVVAQFSLAAAILRHEAALGAGSFEVHADGKPIALVDLQGAIGVRPTAGPAQFADALWKRLPGHIEELPESFVRTDLSQVMWQYAMRTRRDVLPARYRTHLLFFRRPPRLPQRVLRDSHLLVLRELAAAPGTFDDLQQRTGLAAAQLGRELQALYLVGSITANPKRAAAGAARRRSSGDSSPSLPPSVVPSSFDTAPDAMSRSVRPPAASDMTAPAPLWPR